MNTKNQFFPQIAFHPGETLAEKLDELDMGPNEFAIRTDKPEKTIIAVLKGDSSITPDMAVRFEHVLKIPAHFWLIRQREYDEYLARVRRKEEMKETIAWAKHFPVAELIKKQWFPACSGWEEKANALLDFFGFSNHIAWEKYYLYQASMSHFRISLASSKDPYAMSAWLRKGELQAQEVTSNAFSEEAFKTVLPDIKRLMNEEPLHYFVQMQKLCASAGVKLVYTPCLAKVPACGSTRWSKHNPLIQMTGRYHRNDIFWFSFFHEAGHILLHNKRDIFLENTDYPGKASEKEKEADDFAVKWTLSNNQEKEIIQYLNASNSLESAITVFAAKFETNPAIIVGRLQHLSIIDHSVGNHYTSPVELD